MSKKLLFYLVLFSVVTVNAQWVETGPYGVDISCFAVSPNGADGTNLFAGTTGNGVYLDNGRSWSGVNNGLIGNLVINALAVSSNGTGGTNLFAGTNGNGVFLSTNNGRSWTAVNTGLMGNLVIGALAVSPNGTGGTNLFAGTAGKGVYLSTNNGTSWTAVNTGLANTYVFSLAVSGTNLFAGANGNGVWIRPLSEMITGVDDKHNNIPTTFSLLQNYPNPFNPSTVISWQLPVGNFVTLKVYDILGREVKTLVNEQQAAGIHTITFNAEGLASGVYFYRLTAGNFVETKKLVLIK